MTVKHFKVNQRVRHIETGMEGTVTVTFPDGACCVEFDDPAVSEPYFHPTELEAAATPQSGASGTGDGHAPSGGV